MELKGLEEKAGKLRLNGMKISENGEVIYEKYWEDDCRRNIYSASKSFTSAAVGIAVREGLISLSEPLTEAFGEDIPEEPDENLKAATVRDLLTMNLGQANGFLMGKQRPYIQEDDWVKAALKIPFVYKPGTHYVYNNVGPYLAGILVQRRCGCDLLEYLNPRLFKPLGIKRTIWETDPYGSTFGAGGLFLTVDELHRFGIMYLQEGQYNGKQILPKEWVDESTRKQSDSSEDPDGYGYLFWMGRYNSYYAYGKYGQKTMIFRDKNAVVTFMADNHDDQALMDAVYEDVYPNL